MKESPRANRKGQRLSDISVRWLRTNAPEINTKPSATTGIMCPQITKDLIDKGMEISWM